MKNYQLIILEKETDSQYETIINFIEETSIKGEVFICDCDHSIDIKPMMEYLKKNSPDILIPIWNIEKENKKSWGKVYILDGEIKDFCEKNNITVTPVMHIGLLDKEHPDYEYYLIDDVYSKVGIREAVKKHRKELQNEQR